MNERRVLYEALHGRALPPPGPAVQSQSKGAAPMEGLQTLSRQVAGMRPGLRPWPEPRLLSVLLALPLSPPWEFGEAPETLQRLTF